MITLLKRRKLIETLISTNYKITKGIHWNKYKRYTTNNNSNNQNNNNIDIEQEEEGKEKEEEDTLATHKSRFYQSATKFFRENRQVESCISDILRSIRTIESYLNYTPPSTAPNNNNDNNSNNNNNNNNTNTNSSNTITFEQLHNDPMRMDAIKYQLIIIGEAGGILYVSTYIRSSIISSLLYVTGDLCLFFYPPIQGNKSISIYRLA